MAQSLLSFSNVSKAFGGVRALKDVSFEVMPSECLALVGENGAGKSTLMKILSGVWPHGSYDGEVRFEDSVLKLKDPLQGRAAGISIIHQELCLFPQLTVAENLFLTEAFPYEGAPSQSLGQRVRWPELFAKARELMSELGFEVDVQATIESLSVAKRQLVEIARAFHHEAKCLILDEPTSALSQSEVGHLFEVIRRMKDRMSFIYISHKLDEVFALADRIVVLRDGSAVATLDPKNVDEKEIIRHMVGRPWNAAVRTARELSQETRLSVRNLSHVSEQNSPVLRNISFDLRPGEVLGVAGLMGAGRSELLRSLLGVLPGKREGNISLDGREADWSGINDAFESGVAFVPEDRKKDGLFLELGIDFNISISLLDRLRRKGGRIDLAREQDEVGHWISDMGVRCRDPHQSVRTLSGGNQQKVLLAKMVARNPNILFLDEPTRGIDVGAKEEIYAIIRELAQKGLSLLVVSSELPELLSLCDRVMVLRQGRLAGTLTNDESLTQESVMALAAGTGSLHGNG